MTKNVYQLKVTLDDSKPPIWRRLLVPENVTLYELHAILQIAMGWTNSHLHMFRIGGQIYGDPEDDEFGDLGTQDENRYRLNKVVGRRGMTFHYEYDFGDSWEHSILVEEILPAGKGVTYPVCVKGKRACPPEDVGGVWGYEGFLEAIADPEHEEHDEYLEWVGGEFDPEEFDLEEINTVLPNYRRFDAYLDELYPYEDEEEEEAGIYKLVEWVQSLSKEQSDQFEALELRRNMLAFLAYLGENRVTGTQSTGNLPLKAVREVCARFVHPPELDHTIGDITFKLRSEDDVMPLVFLHVLANVSGLVIGGPARLWQVTDDGQKLPHLPPPVQVAFLLQHWWRRVNWGICFPFSGLGDGPPPGFNRHALACLLALPVGEPVAFHSFADDLIKKSGFSWPIEDQTSAHNILRSAIERMVVDPLVDFGVLEAGYRIEKRSTYDYKELQTICLTPAGKGLLELL
jgi:hypothetical protein